jgi:hypothetical protein
MPSTASNGPHGKPSVALEHESAAAPGLLCFRCGYDLRGLPPTGNCPECGFPIGKSKDARLCDADGGWLRRISVGAGLIVTGFLLGPVGVIAILAGLFEVGIGPLAIGLLLCGVPLTGVFLFSSPEPHGRIQGDRARLLRCFLGAHAVLLCSLVVRLAINPSGVDIPWLGVATAVTAVGTALAALGHASALMKRVPAPGLASFARVLLWLTALGTVMLSLAFGIEWLFPIVPSVKGSADACLLLAGACAMVLAALGGVGLFVRVVDEIERAADRACRGAADLSKGDGSGYDG